MKSEMIYSLEESGSLFHEPHPTKIVFECVGVPREWIAAIDNHYSTKVAYAKGADFVRLRKRLGETQQMLAQKGDECIVPCDFLNRLYGHYANEASYAKGKKYDALRAQMTTIKQFLEKPRRTITL